MFLAAGMFMCSNTKLFKEVEKGSLGNRAEKSVTPLLCIPALCILVAYRVSKCAPLTSSVPLIFDHSYGVYCVTIKDGDNVEMTSLIYS